MIMKMNDIQMDCIITEFIATHPMREHVWRTDTEIDDE